MFANSQRAASETDKGETGKSEGKQLSGRTIRTAGATPGVSRAHAGLPASLGRSSRKKRAGYYMVVNPIRMAHLVNSATL